MATLGRDTVSRLFLFNERLGAEEARSVGLATHTCAHGTAVETALALCEGISRSTMESVRATKELVRELLINDVDLAHWSTRREYLLDSDERRAALSRARQPREKGL